jgi:hypothetical protein
LTELGCDIATRRGHTLKIVLEVAIAAKAFPGNAGYFGIFDTLVKVGRRPPVEL